MKLTMNKNDEIDYEKHQREAISSHLGFELEDLDNEKLQCLSILENSSFTLDQFKYNDDCMWPERE